MAFFNSIPPSETSYLSTGTREPPYRRQWVNGTREPPYRRPSGNGVWEPPYRRKWVNGTREPPYRRQWVNGTREPPYRRQWVNGTREPPYRRQWVNGTRNLRIDAHQVMVFGNLHVDASGVKVPGKYRSIFRDILDMHNVPTCTLAPIILYRRPLCCVSIRRDNVCQNMIQKMPQLVWFFPYVRKVGCYADRGGQCRVVLPRMLGQVQFAFPVAWFELPLWRHREWHVSFDSFVTSMSVAFRRL